MSAPAPALCQACSHEYALHVFTAWRGIPLAGPEKPCRAMMYAEHLGVSCLGICGCPQFQAPA